MEKAKDPLGGNYAVGYTIQHLGLFYRTDKVAPITSCGIFPGMILRDTFSIPET